MITITEPGFYTDLTEEEYHADPCDMPSLSRTVAKILIDRTPGHAKIAHPRLTPPDPESDDEAEPKFDLGTAAHSHLLGRGKQMVALPYKDWRQKAAKEERASYRAAGKIPLLESQHKRVVKMVGAAKAQGWSELFNSGESEVVAVSDDPVAGKMRCMLDRWWKSTAVIVDIKTTDIPLNMENVGRHCASMGYEFQQAFYERVICGIEPAYRRHLDFIFLFIETREPFAVLPVRLPADAMAKGRHYVELACQRWRACREADRWPLFEDGIQMVEYPPWQIAEFSAYSEGQNL